MFGAELRYFDTTVGGVDHFLLYAFYFVPKNQGIFFIQPDTEIFQRGGIFSLFNGENPVAFVF